MLTKLRDGAFAFALSSSSSNSGIPEAARAESSRSRSLEDRFYIADVANYGRAHSLRDAIATPRLINWLPDCTKSHQRQNIDVSFAGD
jgi:hypothetical protein